MMTRDVDRIFVDTNVLLIATDRSRKQHGEAIEFLQEAERGKTRLFACGQVFREYAVVASRPVDVNGLGLQRDQLLENWKTFQALVQVLDESVESLEYLRELIRNYELKGKRIHDANLVAVMRVNGLEHLKTWNPNDFAPFKEIHCM